MNWRLLLTICSIWLITSSSLADDSQWGNLRGKFIFDGPAVKAKTFAITKDAKVFGNTMTDESLTVNAKNKGIANVVVYLLPDEKNKLSVHPSYEQSAKAKLTLAMDRGRFSPHILLLRTTQTMMRINKDEVAHNAHIHFRNDKRL